MDYGGTINYGMMVWLKDIQQITLPSRLRIRVHKEGEKLPLFCKYGFKSVLNAERLLPGPWKLHNGPFLLNVVYRDAAVGYGVNNA